MSDPHMSDQRGDHDNGEGDADETEVREIHALTPPPSSAGRGERRRADQSWETSSHRSSTLSEVLSENFSSMSREFNAMVVAGSTMENDGSNVDAAAANNHLARIGEDELEETNPLAIVPDNNPFPPPRPAPAAVPDVVEEVSLHAVKKEVESKISAWQTAEIAKINNRFKREDVTINGWESEKVDKATARLKNVERKLEEKRARALEKMQNDVAKARRKAEEKRASAEAKRGTKVARILDLANLMKAMGRAPSKRSFF